MFKAVTLLIFIVGSLNFSSAGETSNYRISKISFIPSGRFSPLFGLDKNQKSFPVDAFYMDQLPVTQKDFQEFLRKNSEWKKENIKKIFIDQNYLRNWKPNPPKDLINSPVVYISWFAASAYCESKGGRLPSVLEWEYAAAADELKPNALLDEGYNAKILNWYSKPNQKKLPPVGKNKPNFYGLHDMHGLVWEWTSDFNSSFVTGDNRQDGDQSKAMFCGSGATNALDRANYAGFMRYAMRNSLEAHYAQPNLGFRCAYQTKPEGSEQ